MHNYGQLSSSKLKQQTTVYYFLWMVIFLQFNSASKTRDHLCGTLWLIKLIKCVYLR